MRRILIPLFVASTALFACDGDDENKNGDDVTEGDTNGGNGDSEDANGGNGGNGGNGETDANGGNGGNGDTDTNGGNGGNQDITPPDEEAGPLCIDIQICINETLTADETADLNTVITQCSDGADPAEANNFADYLDCQIGCMQTSGDDDEAFSNCFDEMCMTSFVSCVAGPEAGKGTGTCMGVLSCLNNPLTVDERDCYERASRDSVDAFFGLQFCLSDECGDDNDWEGCVTRVLDDGGACVEAYDACEPPLTAEPTGEGACFELLDCLNEDDADRNACVAATSPAGYDAYNAIFDCGLDACEGLEGQALENCFDTATRPGGECYSFVEACFEGAPTGPESTGTASCGETWACGQAAMAADSEAGYIQCLEDSSPEGRILHDAVYDCGFTNCVGAQGADLDICFSETLEEGGACVEAYQSCLNDAAGRPAAAFAGGFSFPQAAFSAKQVKVNMNAKRVLNSKSFDVLRNLKK